MIVGVGSGVGDGSGVGGRGVSDGDCVGAGVSEGVGRMVDEFPQAVNPNITSNNTTTTAREIDPGRYVEKGRHIWLFILGFVQVR